MWAYLVNAVEKNLFGKCFSCLRSLEKGDSEEFHEKLSRAKMVLFTTSSVAISWNCCECYFKIFTLSPARILCWLCQILARKAQSTYILPSLSYRLDLISWWSTCCWITQVHYAWHCFSQMLDHVTMVWDLRWNLCRNRTSESFPKTKKISPVSTVPTGMQVLLTSLLASSIILFQMYASQFILALQMMSSGTLE